MLLTNEQNSLLNTIKSLRDELIRIGIKEGLTSLNTLTISQQLDEYIVKYQVILNRN